MDSNLANLMVKSMEQLKAFVMDSMLVDLLDVNLVFGMGIELDCRLGN